MKALVLAIVLAATSCGGGWGCAGESQAGAQLQSIAADLDRSTLPQGVLLTERVVTTTCTGTPSASGVQIRYEYKSGGPKWEDVRRGLVSELKRYGWQTDRSDNRTVGLVKDLDSTYVGRIDIVLDQFNDSTYHVGAYVSPSPCP